MTHKIQDGLFSMLTPCSFMLVAQTQSSDMIAPVRSMYLVRAKCELCVQRLDGDKKATTKAGPVVGSQGILPGGLLRLLMTLRRVVIVHIHIHIYIYINIYTDICMYVYKYFYRYMYIYRSCVGIQSDVVYGSKFLSLGPQGNHP